MTNVRDRVAGSADPATLPHGDWQCGARWSGSNTCHCKKCHTTFTSVAAFDAHKPLAGCLTPEELGMVLAHGRAYEAWRLPDRSPSLPVPSSGGTDEC